MALRIAAGRTVEDDAAAAFLRSAGVSVLKAKLRLSDPGGAHDDGQRAGDQPAPEQLVEAGNSR
jgi:hypothetical protein